jgi:hypothetical protein
LADGMTGGLHGYYVDYMACVLHFHYVQAEENAEAMNELAGNNLNVTLDCGYFNKNDITDLIAAHSIREILSKKYQKEIDELRITVTKSDEAHLAGSIVFGQGWPGEGGMFLAVKQDDLWQVVFDGNGAVDCDEMRQEYGFSDEILKPNFCD